MDGLSAIDDMRLNPGVLYTRLAWDDFVACFDGERYVNGGFEGLALPAAFVTEDILAKDWYVFERPAKPEAEKLSELVSKFGQAAALDHAFGPDFARGVLYTVGMLRQRGL